MVDVIEHRSELGQWRVTQRRADARLHAYVHGYLAVDGYRAEAIRERHLPSTEVVLLINLGAPHRTLTTQTKRWTTFDHAWVVGLHNTYYLTEAVGARRFMVVRFSPIGAHLFLRAPMDLIENQTVQLAQFDPKLARLLRTRLAALPNWETRFGVMESLVAERVIAVASETEVVLAAWNRLRDADGRIGLGLLASELQCSHRQLITQFRDSVGLLPKTIARLLRFNRAVQLVNRLGRDVIIEPVSRPYIEVAKAASPGGEQIRWAEMAADCGYFDQSHFIKEFQGFSGLTPVEFLHQDR